MDALCCRPRGGHPTYGAILLTGTGVAPPDDFTLHAGDVVNINITGIGRLTNIVEQQI